MPNFKQAAARGLKTGGKRRGGTPPGGARPNLRSAAGQHRMGSGVRGDAGVNFRINGDEAGRIAQELEDQLMQINAQGSSFGGQDPNDPSQFDVNMEEGDPSAPMQAQDIGRGTDDMQAAQGDEAQETPEQRRLRIMAMQGLA